MEIPQIPQGDGAQRDPKNIENITLKGIGEDIEDQQIPPSTEGYDVEEIPPEKIGESIEKVAGIEEITMTSENTPTPEEKEAGRETFNAAGKNTKNLH